MTTGLRDPASLFAGIANIRIRNPSNVLKRVAVHYRDPSNVLRSLTGGGAFAVSASPDNLYGFGSSPSVIYVNTSDAGLATPSGGTPPYTYAWETDDTDWDPISPASAASYFRSPVLDQGATAETQARCVVTDANGAVGTSDDIHLYAANIYVGI